MSTFLYVLLVIVLWLALGLGAALYLGRQGYRSPSWYLLGAALGPLFVPIAEYVTHHARVPVLLAGPPERG